MLDARLQLHDSAEAGFQRVEDIGHRRVVDTAVSRGDEGDVVRQDMLTDTACKQQLHLGGLDGWRGLPEVVDEPDQRALAVEHRGQISKRQEAGTGSIRRREWQALGIGRILHHGVRDQQVVAGSLGSFGNDIALADARGPGDEDWQACGDEGREQGLQLKRIHFHGIS